MKKTIQALGMTWPDTGRSYPEGVRLEVHDLHSKWLDLMWLNENGQWQYISTLPKDNDGN